MDSNRVSFLALQSAADFANRSLKFAWDGDQQALRLEQMHDHRFPQPTRAQALQRREASRPLVVDHFGQLGSLSTDGKRFQVKLNDGDWRDVRTSLDDADAATIDELTLAPVIAPEGCRFVDLHLGGGSRAALAVSGDHNALTVLDLQRRWRQSCPLTLKPQRLWIDADQRVWIVGHYLDGSGEPQGALALAAGEPLPQPYRPPALQFHPQIANPQALRQRWRRDMAFYDGVLAICADADSLYILAYETTDDGVRQHLIQRPLLDDDDTTAIDFPLPADLPFAVDIAPVGVGRIALLVPTASDADGERAWDCPVMMLHADSAEARLVGERYRMLSLRAARFVTAFDDQPRYLGSSGPMPLMALPQARFPRQGVATLQNPLDSLTPDTLWHRLYLEACIPAGCDLQVFARAFDDPQDKSDSGWQLQPPPLWVPMASELTFYGGWKTPQRPYQGLYQMLLQREAGACRELRGRFLQLKIQMSGDGRHTPAIHAIRAYFPRFSWQEHYLPGHFQQNEAPLAGDTRPANSADFRERLLASLEGLLTPIEDRIAAAEAWVDPAVAPLPHLQTLAAMLGVTLPAHWPAARQRDWLAFSGQRQRWRGTMAGLCLALDIATDGGVSRGQVIPVEHFRLRRTMATILGLDLSDDNHPLTLGTGQSGNSIVGDSLILSADDAREFLALLAPELAERNDDDRRIVAEFFDRYSHRLTVILHGPAAQQQAGVEALLRQEAPAHLQWTVKTADQSFVPGLSPLLQIHTYLQKTPGWRRLILDRIRLGRDSVLTNPIALAPEWIGGSTNFRRPT